MGYALTINGLTTHNLRIVANEMSEDDFFDFCQKNQNLRIERDADKTIKIRKPTGSESGYTEMEVSSELRNWSKIWDVSFCLKSSLHFFSKIY